MIGSNLIVELYRPVYLQTETTMCTPDKVEEVIRYFIETLPSDELSWTISVTPTATVYYNGETNDC
jgi:hypothetical protein